MAFKIHCQRTLQYFDNNPSMQVLSAFPCRMQICKLQIYIDFTLICISLYSSVVEHQQYRCIHSSGLGWQSAAATVLLALLLYVLLHGKPGVLGSISSGGSFVLPELIKHSSQGWNKHPTRPRHFKLQMHKTRPQIPDPIECQGPDIKDSC